MKKIYMKILSVIMAAVFVFGSAPLGGIDFSELAELFRIEAAAGAATTTSKAQLEGAFYYADISGMEDYIEEGKIIESGVEILKYMGSDENVVIPSELGGKPVVVIGQYAFCPDALTQKQKDKNEEYQSKYNRDYYLENINCSFIESVTIPASVFYISIDAFKNCVNLEKIEFAGEGIEWIDERAFENTALTEINIPRTLKGIGVNCFNKTEITDIVFGKNDADYFELWWNAFYGSKVRTVTFKSNGVQIYASSFTGSYVNTVTFEGSVELFEKGAMPINNNPIQEIIFKSDYPAELSRMLVLEYGYNCYYYSDYVSFSKRAPSHSGVINTDEYSYTVENNYATIVDYFGTSGEVDIPETLGGYVVNKIGSTAFRDFSYYDKITGKTILLSDVRIPSSVKEIGAFAFADNGFLSNVEFGSGLQKIGASAFAGCTVLYDVALPSTTKEIGDYCFMDTNLKTFSAPGIKKIPVSAFENCARLSSIVLSDEMESIGAYAFNGCTSLRNIVIPEGTTVIEPYTFQNCTSLTSITLPESIREIGRYAFNNCTSLKTVTNTGFIETLGEYAFAEAPLASFSFSSVKGEIPEYCFNNGSFNGTTVTIPSTVEKIGQYAFNCCDFSKLIINDGLKEIGKFAFYDNDNLKELNVPGTVEVIPQYCFGGCSLTKLVLNEGIKKIQRAAFSVSEFEELTIPESLEEISEHAFYNVTIETLNYNAVNCKLKPIGSQLNYDESPFFTNVYSVNIGDKVESLPDCFLSQTPIESVTVPENVKNVGSFAFYYCTKLTEVNLPDTLQVIGNYAFGSCKGLTEFTIPKGLTTFKASVLDNCASLETINFNAVNCTLSTVNSSGDMVRISPFASNTLKSLKYFNIGEGVVNIPDSLCAGMKFLEQITLPSTVTDIGEGSFYKCGFDTIELPPHLESIGEYAFACSNLKSIDFPESMRIISRYAFTRCTKLESVDMKNGIVYLGDDVFNSCSALKTVTLSENINTIPERVFRYCYDLEEIYIPDNVVRIGENAFQACDALVKVRMSPNVSYIADEAFFDCGLLSEFIWDSDSKLIGKLAFGSCVSLKDFNFIGIEKLYENSFKNSGISVVTLGEAKNEETAKLEEIEAQSFMECENLEALGIGGNVAVIKTQAFANCTNLETAVIADSVTQIAPDAFDGCDNLTIYCSENSYAYTYATEQGIPVSTFVIAAIPNHTYTGSKIEPKVSVSLSGKSLSENSDFSVGYDNNINVGKADVNVKGKGVYKMFASKANFTIVTKNISLAAAQPVVAQKYTGYPVEPDVLITDGKRVLKEGTDYTLSYRDNVNEGTGKITVRGIGNYSGSAEYDFVIENQSIFRAILNAISSFFRSLAASIRSIFTRK